MRIFKRKSRSQRLRETLKEAPSGITSAVPDVGSSKAMKAGLFTAGGLAGLTAVSAGLASLRRRSEGQRDDS